MTEKTRRDTALLVPAAAGATGLGVLAAEAPLVAGGIAAVTILALLPWIALFLLIALFASIQNFSYQPFSGIEIAGVVVRPVHLILVPFAIRVYLLTRGDLRLRWGPPEWLLAGFVVLQPITSLLNSPRLLGSLPAAGLLALGVLAYLAVHASICTSRRLILASRIFLGLVIFNAIFGIIALAAHVLLHTSFGVSTNAEFGVGVFGLSYEHDIFASTCAAGAIAFYSFWREPNGVFSSRLSVLGFWSCVVGMLLGLARGAWIGFGVAFLLLVLLPRRGLRRPAGLERVGVTLIVLVLVGVASSYVVLQEQGSGSQVAGIQAKASQLVNIQSGTGRARLGELQTALQDLPASPFIGLGTSSYDLRHPQRFRTNYIGNIYLRALYDSGALGLLLLVAALLMVLWPSRAVLNSRGDMAVIARALLFGWMVLSISYAATDATLLVWPWIFLGLVRASKVLAERELFSRRGTVAAPDVAGNGGTTSGRSPVLVPTGSSGVPPPE